MSRQTAFIIHATDSVATALTPLSPGPVTLFGETEVPEITAIEDVPKGHKIALRRIAEGENILKYGVPIGRATMEIEPGMWVHLHRMCSNYDERSSHLDVNTGAPKDTKYE